MKWIEMEMEMVENSLNDIHVTHFVMRIVFTSDETRQTQKPFVRIHTEQSAKQHIAGNHYADGEFSHVCVCALNGIAFTVI